MSQGKQHYTIEELTKRWRRTKGEIEGYVTSGALKAGTWQGIDDPDESDEIHSQKEIYISQLIEPRRASWNRKRYPRGTQLVVNSGEVERFEVENHLTAIPLGNEAPYLDPDHKHFSKELAVAIESWLALYGDGGNYSPRKSHKTQIEMLLKSRGLSNSAIERISTLVNPNKGGGAPASGS